MSKTTILLATALSVTVAFSASHIFISGVSEAISTNLGGNTDHAESTGKEAELNTTSNGSNSGLAKYKESATIER